MIEIAHMFRGKDFAVIISKYWLDARQLTCYEKILGKT